MWAIRKLPRFQACPCRSDSDRDCMRRPVVPAFHGLRYPAWQDDHRETNRLDHTDLEFARRRKNGRCRPACAAWYRVLPLVGPLAERQGPEDSPSADLVGW